MLQSDAETILFEYPYLLGQAVGFDKLTALHNDWILRMIYDEIDETLQAHRGSYKTTCVSISLACIIIAYPDDTTMFMRKTDDDVKEVIRQVKNILLNPITQEIVRKLYGCNLTLTVESATEISTNLSTSVKGTSQLVAIGVNGSITGKHYDRIFTDDIVNIKDRTSKAERDHTKLIYDELQNVKNRGGRIFNTGTPWHVDDCFKKMPNLIKYDCYSTGLMSEEEIAEVKKKTEPSLFAANYELRHIASDNVMFTDPITNADPAFIEQGESHIDAAYGGEDFTAFTIVKLHEGKWYVYGRLWHKHVDDVLDECLNIHDAFMAGRINVEDNGDKGYLAKAIRDKGYRAVKYHEKMNKHIKISTYLKAEWSDVVFVKGTDQEYINQICDYTEDAEHDDAPDSLASILRKLSKKKRTNETPTSTSANYLY